MNPLRKIISESIQIAENTQLADKVYFNKGLLSPEVKKYILHITGGDALTKLISDIYYAEVTQWKKQGAWAVNVLNEPGDEEEKPSPDGQNDVMKLEAWKKIKAMYLQLKAYNKNVFPIKGFDNINGVKDIWNLIGALKQREAILKELGELPSIARRNMSEEIREPRNNAEMQHYRSRIEYFTNLYSLLSNREGRIKAMLDKKMFKSGITLKDLIDFAEEKPNLIGGKRLSKADVIKIINENDDELSIVYEKGNTIVVDVTGPEGIKAIGCNSVWCFTYGPGVYRNNGDWHQNSTNNHVYVIIDFGETSDSPYFMHVLIKPLDFNSEVDDENGDRANEEKMADMANQFTDNPLGVIYSFMDPEDAPAVFNFGKPFVGKNSEWPYKDPNQTKLDLQEVRMMIRRQFLEEAKKSKFEKLKDNKIPLTDEERKKVMDADAVWHFSPGNKPSPAVWKSKDKKTGKITYVTNTHRAYQDRPTLKGAISIFHSFIKGTS